MDSPVKKQVNRYSSHAFVAVVTAVWVGLVAASFFWNWRQEDKSIIGFATAEGYATFNKDLVFRRWATSHGGVYVAPSEKTPPNPHLSHIPDRDVVTTSGKKLTLINPAYMTRQIHEMGTEQYGVQGHITSLNPIRPENVPDEWEKQALQFFERGTTKEVSSLVEINGEPYLRFMRPMMTEMGCLKCHGAQGYRVGDIRGGISVSVPFAPYLEIAAANRKSLFCWHILLGLLGGVGLWAGGRQLRRTQMELVSSQSESERLATREMILSSLGEGVFGVGMNGECMFINPAALAMLGHEKDAVLGRDTHSLFHHSRGDNSVYPEEECPVCLTLKDGKTREVEDSFVGKNGVVFPVHLLVTAMRQQAEIIGAVVSFRDITDIKEAHDRLFRSQQMLQLVLDTIPQRVFWKDRGLTYLGCNRSYAADCGFAGPEELIGKTDCDLSLCEKTEICDTDDCQVMDSNQSRINYEESIRLAGDSLVWRRTSKVPLCDRQGSVFGILGVYEDITERKQVEMELQETLDFNRKIVDECPSGIAVYRAEGQCVIANKSLAKTVGALVPEVLALNFLQIASWRQSSMLETALQALETGMVQRCEADIVTTFGKRVMLDCEFVPIKRSGVPHLLLMTNDISHFRETEKVLTEARQAAEDANQAKGEFLANMSHEIRTPMNAVLGLIRLVLDTDLSPRQLDYLRKIQASSRALLSILNDILDYSKIDAGRLELECVDFHLDDVLHGVGDLFSFVAEEKGVEIFIEVKPDVPMQLKGDPLRMGQVLNNLVGNAVKFTSRGEIHVKVECLERTARSFLLRFSVRDTGIGIAEETKGKLFHAFSQADGSISRRFGGSGLGLVISRKLVTMMGGEIAVESELGRGSEFSFIVQLEPAAGLPVLYDPGKLRNMRVLVVDDQPTSRQILRQTLASWSFDVVTAASGDEAMAAMMQAGREHRPFELFLLDGKMEGVDGPAVAAAVRDETKQGNQPRAFVIMMSSASGVEHLRETTVNLHLDEILIKPFTSAGLFDAIFRIQNRQAGGEQRRDFGRKRGLTGKLAEIRGARLLLVEDNELNQQVARELLEKFGFLVDIAQNGLTAIGMVEAGQYDAVLMDLHMPEMDGFEATKMIRAADWGKNVPIIALTAAALANEKQACLAAGMNDHVAKPLEPDQLAEVLLQWIRPVGRRPNSSNGVFLSEQASLNYILPDSLPGFDLPAAVDRICGNRPLLAGLLVSFAGNLAADLDQYTALMDDGRLPEASRVVHRVRGTSGSLGAMDLYHAASLLEQELKAGSSVSSTRFVETLRAAVQAVQANISLPRVHGVPRPLDRAAINELVRKVRTILAGYDVVPDNLLQELNGVLAGHVDDELLDDLRKQLHNYRYDTALNLLDKIASTFAVGSEGEG